jgi:putative redox protein
MTDVTAKTVPGYKYKVETTANKFTVVADQPAAAGGNDLGPNPKELLQMAIAACTVQTIIWSKDHRKWDINEITATVTLKSADSSSSSEPDGAIPNIHITIEVKGNLSDQQLQAIAKTASRCPVLRFITDPVLVTKSIAKV